MERIGMTQKTDAQEVHLVQKPTMRVLKREDLDAIVEIDKLVSRQYRRDYYERKVETMLDAARNINSSLVAEVDGRIVGFIMGRSVRGVRGSGDHRHHRHPRRASGLPAPRHRQ